MKTCMHVMVVEYANEYYLHRMAQDGTGRWSSLTQIHRISPKDPILLGDGPIFIFFRMVIHSSTLQYEPWHVHLPPVGLQDCGQPEKGIQGSMARNWIY